MKIKHCVILSLLLVGMDVSAHDFSAVVGGQRLYFNITSETKKTVSVTFNGSISDKRKPEVTGVIEIPSEVKNDSIIYKVSAIGQKAFAGARHMRGIVIPTEVETIGDFAFEGCDSLENVVFPGRQVKMGQGVFFKCTHIAYISIGSDWKTIDLTMFRWSGKLVSVNIPAKIETIRGVKKLKHLKSITVDSNNTHYTAVDGLLYSKDGKTLYACPRAYSGEVNISEETEIIKPGAFIDCVDVTAIDLPSSLKAVSFRETSRMEKLKSVTLRSESPISTGFAAGQGKFLFQLCSDKVNIIVPSSAKGKYTDALASSAGEYSETVDGVPYAVTSLQLPDKKNIKGVKNFDKQ